MTTAPNDSDEARHVAEAELRQDLTDAFANPEGDDGLPRALLIGDSISIGYTIPVRGRLRGRVAVHRPPENCQHTGHGLARIHDWLGTAEWDVIHLNFGIWDHHLLDAEGNIVNDGTPAAAVRHTPERYVDNVRTIIDIAQATGARIAWATTTPVRHGVGPRSGVIPEFNRRAAALMAERGIPVNDLYTFVLPHLAEWQEPDQCHFNATGRRCLGVEVADFIWNIVSRTAETRKRT